ncbi:D-methionine transport system substrate-binding protein [Pseudomonas sp. NFACC25]|uniref:MetQ/NlpA family ABC transporter substrate-binding protein n=1 Tax=Pseudomonas sp. NFACC25 TaxID=1566188 RepID=UPI0008762BE1|nr:MetQ/NlpA family ABC transporter substrate-binding protein [Pseudomonas sp. NFACC25]SCX37210.1 D-methionine transport system substrate-binding protein [Pseudomonas sp. NFACC25]
MLKKATLTLAALLASFSVSAADPLRVAVDPIPHAQILEYVQKLDPSLNLKIIEIPSGVNSNELLAHGDVDANYFQHLPYLNSQEQALGQKFAVAATVHIEPLGIYSRRHVSFAQVPDKGTVAVPNNVTNLSRALYLLQANGLIKLKPGFNDPAKDQATPKDIAENPRHLKILEIESPQIPRALEDVDLAVINGNFALEAGLEPAKDALGLEQAKGNPYANILVTTPKLLQDSRIQKLANDLRSPAVAKFITEKYAGSVIPVAVE